MNRKTAGLVLLAAGAAYAQSAPEPRFEVASIRPGAAGPAGSGINSGHGRITAASVTLKRCIMGAYGVGPNQIAGGPDWLDADRFEINAKSAQLSDGDSELMLKLRSLLAERFHLALHREGRPIQAYVLDVAKNGPRLEKGGEGGAATNSSRGEIVATNATMDRFAEILSRQMDLPVVNRTGLPGVFNVKLQWTPEGARPAASLDAPSIFTAIQEQLGLRLSARKAPLEILVIDHAERPDPN